MKMEKATHILLLLAVIATPCDAKLKEIPDEDIIKNTGLGKLEDIIHDVLMQRISEKIHGDEKEQESDVYEKVNYIDDEKKEDTNMVDQIRHIDKEKKVKDEENYDIFADSEPNPDQEDAAVNGGYSAWGRWSKCTKDCGGGTKVRERTCNNPTPANGGNDCVGPSIEKKDCLTRKCPHQLPKRISLCEGAKGNITCPSKHKIHIISAVYGRVSTRICSSSTVSNTSCRASTSERKVTDLCSNQKECSLSASDDVFGNPCVGTSKYLHVIYRCFDHDPGNQRILICQRGAVNLTCASSNQAIYIVSAKYGRRAPYICPPTGPYTKHCNAPTTEAQVKRDCNGKHDCLLRSSNSVFGNPCNQTTTYLEVIYKCIEKKIVVDGNFTAWSSWEQCSKSCGGGTQRRLRICSNPAPSNGGKDCVGDSQETQACNTNSCSVVDGNFTAWSSWEQCTKSCGGGQQRRHRTCTNPAPTNGGKDCVGDLQETQACNTNNCSDVHGNWSSWSTWSTCSKSCGGGNQTRLRTCKISAHATGDQSCIGSSIGMQPCKPTACPVTSRRRRTSRRRITSRRRSSSRRRRANLRRRTSRRRVTIRWRRSERIGKWGVNVQVRVWEED